MSILCSSNATIACALCIYHVIQRIRINRDGSDTMHHVHSHSSSIALYMNSFGIPAAPILRVTKLISIILDMMQCLVNGNSITTSASIGLQFGSLTPSAAIMHCVQHWFLFLVMCFGAESRHFWSLQVKLSNFWSDYFVSRFGKSCRGWKGFYGLIASWAFILRVIHMFSWIHTSI